MAKSFSAQAQAFLREKRFAVLATLNQDGTIQQTTMWYLLEDDGTIMMNTKVGRLKERNLRRDQRISICIEDGYSYVSINGSVELIDDQETAQHDIYRLSERYHGPDNARKQMEEQFSHEQRVTLRLTCEKIHEYLD